MATPSMAIHVGLPRTGTTTLQTHLFAAHSEIDFLGIYKGAIADATTRHNSMCRDRDVGDLMREVLFERHLDPDLAAARRTWEAIRDRQSRRSTVWSWEGLAMDVREVRQARADNLAEVLGPAHIFITLRHPYSLLESSYFQILRRNNRGADSVWFQPIDAWLEEHWQGEIHPLLDYGETAEIYARTFGEECVHVLLFEDLQEDPAAFVSSIAAILDIDEQEAVSRVERQHENATSESFIDLVRRAQRLPFGRLATRLGIIMAGRGWGRRSRTGDGPRIAEQGRARIAEHTRAANCRLSERFGLDLQRYDYPT